MSLVYALAVGTVGILGNLGIRTYSQVKYAGYRLQPGIGCADVTDELKDLRDELIVQWDLASDPVKESIIKDMTTLPHAGDSWDIQEMLGTSKKNFTRGNPDGFVPDSLTVNREVYFADEVNYFLFGVANYLANRDGINGHKSHQEMFNLVLIYKIYGAPWDSGKDTAWPRAQWAAAGWRSARAGIGGPLHVANGTSLPNATASTVPYTGTLNARIGYQFGPGPRITANSNPGMLSPPTF